MHRIDAEYTLRDADVIISLIVFLFFLDYLSLPPVAVLSMRHACRYWKPLHCLVLELRHSKWCMLRRTSYVSLQCQHGPRTGVTRLRLDTVRDARRFGCRRKNVVAEGELPKSERSTQVVVHGRFTRTILSFFPQRIFPKRLNPDMRARPFGCARVCPVYYKLLIYRRVP